MLSCQLTCLLPNRSTFHLGSFLTEPPQHRAFLGGVHADMPACCKIVQWQSWRAELGCGYCLFQASNEGTTHCYKGCNEEVPQTIAFRDPDHPEKVFACTAMHGNLQLEDK